MTDKESEIYDYMLETQGQFSLLAGVYKQAVDMRDQLNKELSIVEKEFDSARLQEICNIKFTGGLNTKKTGYNGPEPNIEKANAILRDWTNPPT